MLTILTQLLAQADNFWVRLTLGTTALGYFAGLYLCDLSAQDSAPISGVAGGAYAEVKANHLRLSQLFFEKKRKCFVGRAVFFLSACLILTHLNLFAWCREEILCNLITFRLLLLFALLNPINATLSSLFLAVGEPGQLLRIRLVQVLVLFGGLLTLGYFQEFKVWRWQ